MLSRGLARRRPFILSLGAAAVLAALPVAPAVSASPSRSAALSRVAAAGALDHVPGEVIVRFREGVAQAGRITR